MQSLFLVNKFDNALAGVHFDSGTTGVVVNAGNKYATGQFWTAEHCPGAHDHDNELTSPTGEHGELLYTLFGPALTQPLLQGQLPVYPPPPHCNPKGLTPLGEHLIRSMMRRGMIIETDHLSVKARQETLDDPRGRRLSRRDLEPQLGRRGQPEAHPAPRRPDRAHLRRGQRLRGGVA